MGGEVEHELTTVGEEVNDSIEATRHEASHNASPNVHGQLVNKLLIPSPQIGPWFKSNIFFLKHKGILAVFVGI